MSEALSSSEIEDVLSSIRRLVSDDMRPTPRGPAPATEGEKLLLTPALRVVQNEVRPVETPVEAAIEAHLEATAIDAVVATVSAGVSQQDDEWESETGDTQAMPDETAPAPDWLMPEAEQDGVEDLALEVPQPTFADAASLQDDAPEPLLAEQPLPGWAQASAQDEDETPAPEPWVGGTVEPDRAWADEAEAKVLQELTGNTRLHFQMDADEIVLNPAETEVPVNEEMLREIVRDVLREELQGRLGERITRNIRKLVRAEIARVMASEEFL